MDREPVALAVAHAVDVVPATSTRPAVGTLEPAIISNNVVLPAPLGPITPTISGSSKRQSTARRKAGVRSNRPRR